MKRIQIQSNGIRTIHSKKGCHSCVDCEYYSEGACAVKHRSSLFDRNFPYDNTKCEEFKDGNEKQ
jgi:hypothetical protein